MDLWNNKVQQNMTNLISFGLLKKESNDVEFGNNPTVVLNKLNSVTLVLKKARTGNWVPQSKIYSERDNSFWKARTVYCGSFVLINVEDSMS